jgi:hypothetical protein
MVVQRLEVLLGRDPDRVQVTGDRFFPFYFPVIVSLLNTTFQDALFVIDGVNTFAAADNGRAKLTVIVSGMRSFFFNDFNSFFGSIRFYHRIDLFQYRQLIFIQWCAKITFHATGTFAFFEVADKLLIPDII